MTEDILWYVENYDWVTFAELQHRYGTQAKGGHAIYLNNIVLWVNLSEQLATAITSLLEEKSIHAHPASFLAYMVDGAYLTLPLAKHPPKRGYKKDHWLPVCFRSGPFCNLNKCPANMKRRKLRLSAQSATI